MKPLEMLRDWMPHPADRRVKDLALQVASESAALSSMMPEALRHEVRELMRGMNTYYSNLIEGESSALGAVERALRGDYDTDARSRYLQALALSHLEVQRRIDRGEAPAPATSRAFLRWVHREVFGTLPAGMDDALTPHSHTGPLDPGTWRRGAMRIGSHVAPSPTELPALMAAFEEAYRPEQFATVDQVVMAAAAHHRLVWIHPFDDGNGRTTRLMSDSLLRESGIDAGLWSASRGLAWKQSEYYAAIVVANRTVNGHLSRTSLAHFCRYFLERCLGQIRFMSERLQPESLASRIRDWASKEEQAGRLRRGSSAVLEAAARLGAFERGRVQKITGYGPTMASTLTSSLLSSGLLASSSKRGPLHLAIPSHVLEQWFPLLYLGRDEAQRVALATQQHSTDLELS